MRRQPREGECRKGRSPHGAHRKIINLSGPSLGARALPGEARKDADLPDGAWLFAAGRGCGIFRAIKRN